MGEKEVMLLLERFMESSLLRAEKDCSEITFSLQLVIEISVRLLSFVEWKVFDVNNLRLFPSIIRT